MATYNETMSKGLKLNGKARPIQIDGDRFCVCNVFTESVEGACYLSGSAVVTDNHIKGGVTCSGRATVDIGNKAWDGVACWPLSEDGGPYADLGQWSLDGTAGSPETTQDTGVFCGYSQAFTDREFIVLPQDHIDSKQGFSVSCWGKIDSFVKCRMFYTRGIEDRTGNKWVFGLGHSFVNHLLATIQLTDGTTDTAYECYSNTILRNETFYHLATTWTPGEGLIVYVNGSEDGSETATETETVALTTGGYFGKWNQSTSPTGNLQEVRLYGEVMSEDWFRAEHDNYCNNEFYVVDNMEDATFA